MLKSTLWIVKMTPKPECLEIAIVGDESSSVVENVEMPRKNLAYEEFQNYLQNLGQNLPSQHMKELIRLMFQGRDLIYTKTFSENVGGSWDWWN